MRLNILDLILDCLLIVVFCVALARFVRAPDRLQRDVVAVFAAFASVSLARILGDLLPALAPIAGLVLVVALLVQPPLTLRLARHFHHLPRGSVPLAWVGALLAFVIVLSRGASSGAGLAFVVGVVVLTNLVSAAIFAGAARRRVGVARVRLGVSAIATAAFAVALLATGLGVSVAIADAQALQLLARLLAIAAGVGYLIAFLPPAALLQGVGRSVAFGWLDRIARVGVVPADDGDPTGALVADRAAAAASPGDSVTDAVWQALADAAREITGARTAVVLSDDRPVATSGTPLSGEGLATVVREIAGEASPGARVLARPTVASVLRLRIGALPDNDLRVIRLPAASDRPTTLALRFEGTPLFVDDDVTLIRLLATEAQRAIAREHAAQERISLQQQLILERHRADAEARFRGVLDAQPTALIAVGPAGHVQYANTRAVETFASTDHSILGSVLGDLLPQVPDPVPRPGPIETVARRPDGSTFPAEVGVGSLMGADGQVALITVTDISSRKAAEVIRDRFIDLLSHELRTPVTALYGFANLLTRPERIDPELEREVLGDMAVEADRLQRMVENLIALARAERGAPMGGDDPVLLQRLVPRVVANEQRLWPTARFVHHLPPDLATVRGDDDYLGQVLRNLLSNAAKYAGDAGPIDITATQRAHTVLLSVSDRGPGFPPGAEETLFELYYRADEVVRDVPGAGIGLFVCRRIVEAMGGRIGARLRPDGGAVLEVELPVYDPDETGPHADAADAAGAQRSGSLMTTSIAAP